MERIEHKTFYHINSSSHYQIGKTYVFGNKVNPFFKYYEEVEPNNIAVNEKDERYLTPLYFNLPLQRRLAMSYWSGESVSADPRYKEILFSGSATVTNIISLPPGSILEEPETLSEDQTPTHMP